MGKLVIKFRGKPVGDVNLRLGDMTIGRHSTCDIVLNNDKSVSGTHAVIKTVGRKSTLEDFGSTNGTFIETERVTQHELRHGETIVIGEHELIYRDNLALDSAKARGRAPCGTTRWRRPGSSRCMRSWSPWKEKTRANACRS